LIAYRLFVTSLVELQFRSHAGSPTDYSARYISMVSGQNLVCTSHLQRLQIRGTYEVLVRHHC